MTDVVDFGLDDALGLLKPEDGPIIEEDVDRPLRAPTMQAPGVARLTPYVPHVPFPKQRVFLMLAVLEAFYGGAAGGAKSDALLMAALQFVDVPGYAALLLRRTFPQLSQPGGLMHRARLWLARTDATFNEQRHTWTFPSGASLTFGYVARDAHVENYQGGEYQFIGVDESTQLTAYQYRYLFSRLRRPSDDVLHAFANARSEQDGMTLSEVPLRYRGAANPGGESHAFHKRRLVDKTTRRPGVYFVPAKLEDNPYLDRESYERALRILDPVNWQRLRRGDWETRDLGEIFDVQPVIDRAVDAPWPDATENPRFERVRYWDLASSEVKAGTDPDWTVGFKLALDKDTGTFRVEHIVRFRAEPNEAERIMQAAADRDGRYCAHVVEQEPGAEGKRYVSYVRRHLLRGSRVFGDRVSGNKELRIRQLQPVVNNGDVSIVNGPYLGPFIDELDAWPNVEHDDQVDAFAGAHRWLTRGGRAQ